jgi:hypothetical protein
MKSWLVLVVVTATMASDALSAPIVFTYKGRGVGKIQNRPFSEVDFTITAFGDTSNRQTEYAPYPIYSIRHNSASISLDGMGTYQITSETLTFSNTMLPGPGFEVNGYGDVLDGPVASVFSTWNMLSSIGPISGQTWTFGIPVMTTGGELDFDTRNLTGTGSFQATVVPEASTLALFGIGVIGLLAYAWRRRK